MMRSTRLAAGEELGLGDDGATTTGVAAVAAALLLGLEAGRALDALRLGDELGLARGAHLDDGVASGRPTRRGSRRRCDGARGDARSTPTPRSRRHGRDRRARAVGASAAVGRGGSGRDLGRVEDQRRRRQRRGEERRGDGCLGLGLRLGRRRRPRRRVGVAAPARRVGCSASVASALDAGAAGPSRPRRGGGRRLDRGIGSRGWAASVTAVVGSTGACSAFFWLLRAPKMRVRLRPPVSPTFFVGSVFSLFSTIAGALLDRCDWPRHPRSGYSLTRVSAGAESR